MHKILVFSSLMGILAVAQSFGLVLAGMEWMSDPALMARFPLDLRHLQTMLFLQLVAGGHLLLFVVRTRGSFLAPPYPNAVLFWAIVATQVVAVLMCAYGILVPVLPWELIGLVWAYILAWMVVLDLVKLAFFRIGERRAARTGALGQPIAAQ
jgi:H+-transporting ATPase